MSAVVLVLALTSAASALGPELSGLLAPFPIIASILAAFTHAQSGAVAAPARRLGESAVRPRLALSHPTPAILRFVGSDDPGAERPSADELRQRLRALVVFDTELPAFDPEAAPERPEELFAAWLIGAIDAGVREPHAMVLSTVDDEGRPSSRTLILKGLSDGGWEFASSSESRKGRELAAQPWAAASFYWPEQGRQIRLRGRVIDAGAEASARDYRARSPASRLEAAAGHQSEVLADPGDVDAAVEQARADLAADPELVPAHWTLYRLLPDEAEFWQGDRDRRHVRLQYRLHDGAWTRRRLWA